MSKENKQKEYDKRWIEKNREHKRYLSYRSTSRSFIRNSATKDDLLELKKLIDDKLSEYETEENKHKVIDNKLDSFKDLLDSAKDKMSEDEI